MAEATSIHLNARVRGMKSSLFTRAELEELLQQGDMQRLIDRLLDSPYRQELAEALTRHHGADAIEEAVTRNLVNTFSALIRRAQGELREVVALFLERWDLAAIKSLLRLKHHGLDSQEFGAALLPGPGLSVALIQELAEKDSMEALLLALSSLKRQMVQPINRLLPQYKEARDLSLLEEALDRQYFVENAARLRHSEDPDGQMVRHYLRIEIDRINLRSVFQHLAHGDGHALPEEVLLPEGLLKVHFLQDMAASGDIASAVEKLGNTLYRDTAEELFPLLQTGRFAPVERFLERMIMLEVRRMARRDVLRVGVVMDFVWLKFNEVVNLRLVARGLAGNLPPGRVREELNLNQG